ncbi:sortase [Candidatus Parcubacteria bacterium]|jgi:sortase A|nr:MAG: sortase [Candidatus Parcubacteria bacterium]
MVDFQTTSQPRKRGPALWAGLLLIAAGIIILTYPLWPIVRYYLTGPVSSAEEPVFPYESNLIAPDGTIAVSAFETQDQASNNTNQPQNINASTSAKRVKARVISRSRPPDNRLVIPKIGVNLPIVEGQNENSALNRGAWRIPNSSTPKIGGNTVLSAHRFRYRPPSNLTLYLLDKLSVGDIMIVYWQGKEYDYRVGQIKIVPRQNTDIAEPTQEPKLTVFTCHPLFSTKERLVVIGELL